MNEKNLAPKNIEGTYTLTIEGKTITITDSSGHTKTANCAPDDTFNLGEGVNLAMSRLHDKTIRVGDIVKVTRPGQCYTTYVSWIERNVKSIREAALYRYNESIEAGGEYRVLYMAEHGDKRSRRYGDRILCYIQECNAYGGIDDCAPCYLINVEGVEKI
jgi:hypothetical protein